MLNHHFPHLLVIGLKGNLQDCWSGRTAFWQTIRSGWCSSNSVKEIKIYL